MPIEAHLIASLKAAGDAMRGARDPWWVLTGGAVALHGADPGHVADIDVLLSTQDAARILPAVGVLVQPGPSHQNFRSDILGIWNGAPLPIEFMAGFYHRCGTDWFRVEPTTRQPVEVDGTIVFVPDRAELERLLCDFGRPKDIERARRLAALA